MSELHSLKLDRKGLAMARSLTRREFLKTSGIVAGSLIIEGAFAGCASSPGLDLSATGPVNYPKLPGHKIQPPEHYGLTGCYSGIWFGNSPLAIQPESTIKDYEVKAGKKPTFVHIPYRPIPMYYSGTGIDSVIYDRNKSFKLLTTIGSMGIIPFITYDMRIGQTTKSGHKKVIACKLDDEITITSQWLKRYGEEYGGFFIRTMREMNLTNNWPWSISTKEFKEAWKHIWNIFEQEGTNKYATWVFNPYVAISSFGLGTYYCPEERYFDWIGFNGYNFDGQTWGERASIYQMFSNASRIYNKKYPTKPQMICETGMDDISYKPKWVTNGFNTLKTSLNAIKGVAFWSENWSYGGVTSFDSRIDTSPEALAAYREAVSDPYFIGAIGDRL